MKEGTNAFAFVMSALPFVVIGVLIAIAAVFIAKRRGSDRVTDEDVRLSDAIEEDPERYVGLYTGLYRLSKGEWQAWQSWFRTFKKRTVQAHPELASCRLLKDEPADEAAAQKVAQRLLVLVRAARIELRTIENYPEETDSFQLDTGDELETQTPCKTVVPAFFFKGKLLEHGTVERK